MADDQTSSRSIYSKRLSNVQNRYGPNANQGAYWCRLAGCEYDCTIHVRQRCGLLSNFFDHLGRIAVRSTS